MVDVFLNSPKGRSMTEPQFLTPPDEASSLMEKEITVLRDVRGIKRQRRFLLVGMVLAVVLSGGLGYCLAIGPIRFPDLMWWNGIAFWSMVLVAITMPRVYLSLPKRATVKQLVSQGTGSRSWLPLIGVLFLINAVLTYIPDVQDVFIADALRLVDTRFFTLWHWLFFLFGAGGFFVRYLLRTRLIVAELQEKPTDTLLLGYHLATIWGTTFTAVFLCLKFSLVSPVIALPFQWDFPGHYWSIIWAVFAVEIAFFVGQKHHFFDGFTTYFSGAPSFSLRALPLPMIALIVASVGIVAACGVIAWNAIKLSELPWWGIPAFCSLVIAIVLAPKLRQMFPKRPATSGTQDKEMLPFRFDFDRRILVYVTLLLAGFGVVGGIGYVFVSGTVQFSDLPWWGVPAFWSLVIIIALSPKLRQVLPKRLPTFGGHNKEKPSFRFDFDRRIPVYATLLLAGLGIVGGVGYVFVSGTVQFFDLPWWGVPAFWSLVIVIALAPKLYPMLPKRLPTFDFRNKEKPSFRFGVDRRILVYAAFLLVGFGIVGGIGYVFVSGMVRFTDFPWWVMPAFWSTIIVGGVSYRIIEGVRAYLRELPARPKMQQKPRTVGRPVAFNATRSSDGTRTFSMIPTLWIALAGTVGVPVLVYFCYSILTAQHIDADGHPVAMSWWMWPLFLLLVFAAIAAYPLFKTLRENFSSVSRPTTRPSVAPKAAKPVGFNRAGKQRNTQKTSAWQLPSLPKIEGLSELWPVVGVGAVALVGLLIVGSIGYSLLTMERIDADGHPVPMPSWIIPLLLVLVILGVVGYKVVSVLRENSGGVRRPSTIRASLTKKDKPGGFNATGFGKKKVGFNQSQSGGDWFANPVLWLGILGGVVGVLLLVIIFMLIF